jgi:predicted AlkP superfamily pyrophosphatase or phosphodiesterase
MRALLPVVSLAAVLALAAACAPRYLRAPTGDVSRVLAPVTSLTRNVLLVSVDGLRPDAIGEFEAPTLQRLMREGSYSLAARTILPSKTLPSHTSMLSGEPPADHGVFWNNVLTAKEDVVEFDTIFSVARAHGYRTAAFFSKAKFEPLQRPGTLDYSQAPGGWFGRWSSDRTMADVRSYLEKERPNLLFIHLSDPDRAGHSSGWMSDAYGRAVQEADDALGALMVAADAAYGKGHYSLLVTADHGGHGYDHGSNDPRDVTIPWIAWGQGVNAGLLRDVPIQTFDTAPTVLWLLGLEKPDAWDGSAVTKAFLPPASSN